MDKTRTGRRIRLIVHNGTTFSRGKTLPFFRLCLALLFSSSLLAGCWDRREIEERTSVVAIAVDRIEQAGHPLYRVTVQIPIPIQIASGGTGGGGGKSGLEAVRVMSATGKTFIEGMNNLQKRLNQQMFVGHTRIIAFGERLAREGIGEVLDGLRRDPQVRRLMWPIVVKGEAIELLKANPKLEQIPTVFLLSMVETGTKLKLLPKVTLGRLFVAVSNPAEEPILHYVQVEDNDVKLNGIAAFKGDRMVGFLNDEEMSNWLRIAERMNGGDITFPFGKQKTNHVTFHPRFNHAEYHLSEKNGKIAADIFIEIEGNIVETSSPTHFNRQSAIRRLEKELEHALEKESRTLIRKVQKELRSDILGLELKLRAFHYDVWRRIDWEKAFPEADIDVSFDVKLRRTGMEAR
ncbi:Ger(x)C family spore germination protein [Bacillaceae bacterium]